MDKERLMSLLAQTRVLLKTVKKGLEFLIDEGKREKGSRRMIKSLKIPGSSLTKLEKNQFLLLFQYIYESVIFCIEVTL